MVKEDCGSLVELEEKKVDVSTLEKADEKPAPKKWVARPLTTVSIFWVYFVSKFMLFVLTIASVKRY